MLAVSHSLTAIANPLALSVPDRADSRKLDLLTPRLCSQPFGSHSSSPSSPYPVWPNHKVSSSPSHRYPEHHSLSWRSSPTAQISIYPLPSPSFDVPTPSDRVIHEYKPTLPGQPDRLHEILVYPLLIRVNEHEIVTPLIERQTLLGSKRLDKKSVPISEDIQSGSDVYFRERVEVRLEEELVG